MRGRDGVSWTCLVVRIFFMILVFWFFLGLRAGICEERDYDSMRMERKGGEGNVHLIHQLLNFDNKFYKEYRENTTFFFLFFQNITHPPLSLFLSPPLYLPLPIPSQPNPITATIGNVSSPPPPPSLQHIPMKYPDLSLSRKTKNSTGCISCTEPASLGR